MRTHRTRVTAKEQKAVNEQVAKFIQLQMEQLESGDEFAEVVLDGEFFREAAGQEDGILECAGLPDADFVEEGTPPCHGASYKAAYSALFNWILDRFKKTCKEDFGQVPVLKWQGKFKKAN